MPNNCIQDYFSKRFRRLLSNSEDGVPPWLSEIDTNEGVGFFRPSDAPWVVHADLGTLVGGIRALLMQALHPGSLAGVRDHSRYKKDPLGRLAGTIRWLTVTTFGSKQAIAREASRVMKMHQHVKGDYEPAGGGQCPYHATDDDLLLWVHVAFMDSFLRSHQYYSKTPIPGGADAYIRQWSKSVEPLGLKKAPMSEKELLDTISRFRSKLVVGADTREVLHWIKHPPLPRTSIPIYRLLFQAAVVSLPPDFQKMLGQKTLPKAIVVPVTRCFLGMLRLFIGPDSPLEDAAIERIERADQNANKKPAPPCESAGH